MRDWSRFDMRCSFTSKGTSLSKSLIKSNFPLPFLFRVSASDMVYLCQMQSSLTLLLPLDARSAYSKDLTQRLKPDISPLLEAQAQ